MWLVKEGSARDTCEIGKPIACNDIIRLEHVDTGRNLHSHLFRAPLSGNQEVSGFGEGGVGDTGDNWQVVCETGDSLWQRGKPVVFVHVDTKKVLTTSGVHKFTPQNCGGQCPIMDQTEVSCSPKKDANSRWQTAQGVYFPSKDSHRNDEDDGEDEL